MTPGRHAKTSPDTRLPDARPAPLLVVLLGIALSAVPEVPAADLVIRHARLVDGTGAPPREGMAVRIRAGRIAEIGPTVATDGVPVLEAAGATLIPGLIDSHVHLAVAPGSAQRGDPPDVLAELRRQHLRAYLACGVTTVLDTGVDPATARQIRTWLAAGEPGPTYLHLGPMVAAPGGYLADLHPGTANEEDLKAAFAAFDSLGTMGVKVFLEKGFGPREVWPPRPACRHAC